MRKITVIKKSKNKRKKSFELPWYITGSMRILSKISTELATSFALKLFFRPLKFPLPSREIPVRKEAIKHLLQTEKSPFTVYEWPGSGPKVVMLHGWSGRGTQFFKIIEELKARSYHIFAIDAPAHGDSSQKTTHMLEFVDAVEVCQAKFGPFEIAIGHSLGGMAIFNALERNLYPKKIIIVGSPVNIPSVVGDFCKKVNASKAVAKNIVRKIESRYSMKVESASTDFLAKKFNPKGLIIHDEDDADVPIKNARKLAKNWTNAKLIETQGLGHRKVLMHHSVISRIIDFIEN